MKSRWLRRKWSGGRKKTLNYDFEPWMIEALRHHVKHGNSVLTFAAKHKIKNTVFSLWLKEIPEMRAINEQYKKSLRHRNRKL